jgi:predicted SAM-dependent methyltransferase
MRASAEVEEPFRLHIGGQEPREGWKILNIQAGSGVDFVGDCMDLSAFGDASVDLVYASHVYEHVEYKHLVAAFGEVRRILKPGGEFMIGVPDMDILCQMFLHRDLPPEGRFHVMRMMFGGQMDAFDLHKVGFNLPILCNFLGEAGFSSARRVESFGHFHDCSEIVFVGHRISLNVVASKAGV